MKKQLQINSATEDSSVTASDFDKELKRIQAEHKEDTNDR
ncbi:hypothetical protein AGMMS49940_19350 [Spirochaetia bacterium]|nr:hypothetical protein AGMMS49940_19350 [Spirochaetia bacterium]